MKAVTLVRALWLAVLICTPATGQASSCSEPTKPYCINAFGTFDNDFSFQSCGDDMERFKRNTSDYLECLQRANDDAVEAYNKAVKTFNCGARKELLCY